MTFKPGTEWRVAAHFDTPAGDRTTLLKSPDGDRWGVFFSYAAPFSALPQLMEYADEYSARLVFAGARDKAYHYHGENLPIDHDDTRADGEQR